MAFTDQEIKEAYLEWIEQYCQNQFPINNLPGGIKLALKQLMEVDPLSYRVVSEKISDMSQTFSDTQGDVPKYITRYLNPYKRLKSI